MNLAQLRDSFCDEMLSKVNGDVDKLFNEDGAKIMESLLKQFRKAVTIIINKNARVIKNIKGNAEKLIDAQKSIAYAEAAGKVKQPMHMKKIIGKLVDKNVKEPDKAAMTGELFTKSILQMKADADYEDMKNFNIQLKAQMKAKSTQDTYNQSFKAFEAYRIKEKLHHLPCEEVIRMFFMLPHMKIKSNTAKNNYIAAVNFYIKHIKLSSEKLIPMMKVQQRKDIVTIEGDDLNKLDLFRKTFADNKYLIAFDLGIEFGLRKSEMVNMKSSDIRITKLEDGKQIISINVYHGKGNKTRIVHSYYDTTDRLFIQHAERLKGKKYIFLGDDFDNKSAKEKKYLQLSVGRNIYNFIKCNVPKVWPDKVNITVHGLRHSLASKLLTDDISISDIKTVLGHENESMTNKYLSVEAVSKSNLKHVESGRLNINKRKRMDSDHNVECTTIHEVTTSTKTTKITRGKKSLNKRVKFSD